MLKSHLLSALIALSALGSLLVSVVGDKERPRRAQILATFIMVLSTVLGVLLYVNFDPLATTLQFQESYLWLKAWDVRYSVGVDGLSLSFILLTLFITFIVILTANQNQPAYAHYLSHFLLIQALTIGSFAATDAVFFYICWEALLIPVLINIGVWGSQRRAYASIKFFLYTFLGSSALLAAILYLGHQHDFCSFNIQNFYTLNLTATEQRLLFFAFFIAFTIKVPLWPLHSWLPDAHTEAPAEGSIVLAALMLKLGAYGLLRFCLPTVPDAAHEYALFVCILSIIAIIYTGLVALAQTDIKRLIAYSSISHMGMVMLGIFLVPLKMMPTSDFALLSLEGAVLHMITHALSTGGLFLSMGLLYQRFHSRQIAEYQGLATIMPSLATTTFIFILSIIGLPGTGGFVGEFLIIMSALRASFWMGYSAAITLILSATYALYFYGRMFWGELRHPPITFVTPLNTLEMLALSLIVSSLLLIGLFPTLLLTLIETALSNLLHFSLQSKL